MSLMQQSNRYKVLCVGVNKPPTIKHHPLDYAEKNAQSISQYFETLKDNAQVTLLIGENSSHQRITQWCHECNSLPGELNVIFFFSGYATAENICPSIYPHRCLQLGSQENDHHHPHFLPVPEILQLLNNPSHQLIIIIDACYCLPPSSPITLIFHQFNKSEVFATLKKYVIISTSATCKYMQQDHRLRLGILTHYFLCTISGKYTYFLTPEISLTQLLYSMEDKIKNHPFTSNTGRKRPLPKLWSLGLPVLYSENNLYLPILKSKPFIHHTPHNLSQILSYFTLCFTHTRLRAKISLVGCLLIISFLLFYFAHMSIVRVHFIPNKDAFFHNSLLEKPILSLDDLNNQTIGAPKNQEFNYYLFRSNWVNSLQKKLNNQGKIFLQGNLLGIPMDQIPERQLINSAMHNPNHIFYWHTVDFSKILLALSRTHLFVTPNQKMAALKILATLGNSQAATAARLIPFNREFNQELRNFFLEHFYSPQFLQDNLPYINLKDYLLLLRCNKPIPPALEAPLHKLAEKYLDAIALDISNGIPPLTEKEKISTLYRKLELFSSFGSKRFQKMATPIFKNVFIPNEVYFIACSCKNMSDKIWVLEQYFSRVQKINFPLLDSFWSQFIYQFVYSLPEPTKTTVIKMIINTSFTGIPRHFQESLFNYLQSANPKIVTLADWENWLNKYHLPPELIFYSIIELKYKDTFVFLQRHLNDFKNLFSDPIFNQLFLLQKSETLNLAKKIFSNGNTSAQLHAAVFLQNKNQPGYSSFIIRFIEDAPKNYIHLKVLENFFGNINQALLKITQDNTHLRVKLKPVLYHSRLFYPFFKTNMHYWPQESIQCLTNAKIPLDTNAGMKFLLLCVTLPESHRKSLLLKICNSNFLKEPLKGWAESKLATHFPHQYLTLVFNGKYKWGQHTHQEAVKAFNTFTTPLLMQYLALQLKKKNYSSIKPICDALNAKQHFNNSEINLLRQILIEFVTPLERILLRELRYRLHTMQWVQRR